MMGVLGCSSIIWAICKQSVPRCREITTPRPRHSFFAGRMLFLTPNQQCQSTEGKLLSGILFTKSDNLVSIISNLITAIKTNYGSK